jgi:hypothetical protein
LVKRSVNSPWGNVYKEGLPSTAVDDKTEVDQEVRPTINTGSIDVRSGRWEGVTHSDVNFRIDPPHVDVANGAAVFSPQSSEKQYIDMTGFDGLFIAIKPSNGGNVKIEAVMGPDSYSFANLTPVNPAALLRGNNSDSVSTVTLTDILVDSADLLTADVWNIYFIGSRLREQKLLQFKITNNSGGISSIDFAYLRVV